MKRLNTIILFACLALLAPLVAVAKASPEPPVPPEGCRYVEAGKPGPAGNWLLIDRNEGGVGLHREGDAIVVYSPVVEGKPLTCEGPRPTVDNIDRIVYRPPGGGNPPRISHRLDVDLSGGLFAPGASPDHTMGGREVEIVADFPREPPNKWSTIHIRGSDLGDRMRIGALSRGRTGVNLDLTRDHGVYDADLIVSAADDAHFSLRGEGGNDRIGATGMGPEFEGPIPQRSLEIRGGDGSDTVYAGRERDIIAGNEGGDAIYGGGGNDRLRGDDGADRIFGQAGRDDLAAGPDAGMFNDSLSGGSGRDTLSSAEGGKDFLLCGSGLDRIEIDPVDKWSHTTCEKAHIAGTG